MINIEPPSTLPGAVGAPVLSKAGLTRFLHRAQSAVGVAGVVDVLLADDATLKRLNRQFRGKNKATDVLSFPAPGVDEGGDAGFAGDIAISLETAGRQAGRFGHSLRDEVRILLVHGLLHLSGMDHETDDGEMAEVEGKMRVGLGLPVSLIERVMVGGATGGRQPRARGLAGGTAEAVPLSKARSKSNGKGNGKSDSRFPSGMTTKKAAGQASSVPTLTNGKAVGEDGAPGVFGRGRKKAVGTTTREGR